jgi:hypothetical protein
MGLRGFFLAYGLIALGAVPLGAVMPLDDDRGVTGGGGSQLPPYMPGW